MLCIALCASYNIISISPSFIPENLSRKVVICFSCQSISSYWTLFNGVVVSYGCKKQLKNSLTYLCQWSQYPLQRYSQNLPPTWFSCIPWSGLIFSHPCIWRQSEHHQAHQNQLSHWCCLLQCHQNCLSIREVRWGCHLHCLHHVFPNGGWLYYKNLSMVLNYLPRNPNWLASNSSLCMIYSVIMILNLTTMPGFALSSVYTALLNEFAWLSLSHIYFIFILLTSLGSFILSIYWLHALAFSCCFSIPYFLFVQIWMWWGVDTSTLHIRRASSMQCAFLAAWSLLLFSQAFLTCCSRDLDGRIFA